MRVIKRSDDAQMRVKKGPVITRDDMLLRVVYLRRAFMTYIYDTQLRHAMHIKEGPVIKDDDTHLRVVTLRRACL